MWAWLRLNSLFGLTCGLLWLCPVLGGPCPDSQKLLKQLKDMAKRDFFEAFARNQGLHLAPFPEICKRTPDFFPTEKTLRELPAVAFLQNVNDTLYLLEERLEKNVFKDLVSFISGINNNVCCLLQTLSAAPLACSTPESKGTVSTPDKGSLRWKTERCQMIWGYQRFMQAVERVLETWPPSPRQSNRNSRSLLRALLEQRKPGRAG
uniref:Oncostatin M n=1 Tax=Monodelphis domestica TaxID=13616 RepID=A0A5F8G376_MONDO